MRTGTRSPSIRARQSQRSWFRRRRFSRSSHCWIRRVWKSVRAWRRGLARLPFCRRRLPWTGASTRLSLVVPAGRREGTRWRWFSMRRWRCPSRVASSSPGAGPWRVPARAASTFKCGTRAIFRRPAPADSMINVPTGRRPRARRAGAPIQELLRRSPQPQPGGLRARFARTLVRHRAA